MMPADPRELALLLEGVAIGAIGVFGLAGVAIYLDNVRRRVGAPLVGDGIERAKKRGDL